MAAVFFDNEEALEDQDLVWQQRPVDRPDCIVVIDATGSPRIRQFVSALSAQAPSAQIVVSASLESPIEQWALIKRLAGGGIAMAKPDVRIGCGDTRFGTKRSASPSTVQAVRSIPSVDEVWVIDDGSTDSTASQARAAGARGQLRAQPRQGPGIGSRGSCLSCGGNHGFGCRS